MDWNNVAAGLTGALKGVIEGTQATKMIKDEWAADDKRALEEAEFNYKTTPIKYQETEAYRLAAPTQQQALDAQFGGGPIAKHIWDKTMASTVADVSAAKTLQENRFRNAAFDPQKMIPGYDHLPQQFKDALVNVKTNADFENLSKQYEGNSKIMDVVTAADLKSKKLKLAEAYDNFNTLPEGPAKAAAKEAFKAMQLEAKPLEERLALSQLRELQIADPKVKVFLQPYIDAGMPAAEIMSMASKLSVKALENQGDIEKARIIASIKAVGDNKLLTSAQGKSIEHAVFEQFYADPTMTTDIDKKMGALGKGLDPIHYLDTPARKANYLKLVNMANQLYGKGEGKFRTPAEAAQAAVNQLNYRGIGGNQAAKTTSGSGVKEVVARPDNTIQSANWMPHSTMNILREELAREEERRKQDEAYQNDEGKRLLGVGY